MAQDVRNALNKQSHSESYLQWMLHLSAVPGFGSAAFNKIKLLFGDDLGQLFTLADRELVEIGFNHAQREAIRKPRKSVESALAWLASSLDHSLLHFDHEAYPSLLKEISSAPLVLYCRGNTGLLGEPQLAVVGSRNPTHYGKTLARAICRSLAKQGWTITSGLAMGIDAAGHQGALDVNGHTVAVLGTGVDVVYPKRNKVIFDNILSSDGCILSEFAPGTAARAEHFPRRNRIISGLSLGTLVVEAAIKSGSLISARYALEQNREVFAVPGNIGNPLSKGCHYLIKQGAKLVESCNDISDEFHDLSFLQGEKVEKKLQKNDCQRLASDQLLDSVDYDVTAVDVVAQRSNMSISDVLAQLLQYELRGLVATVPGGYIKLGGK